MNLLGIACLFKAKPAIAVEGNKAKVADEISIYCYLFAQTSIS